MIDYNNINKNNSNNNYNYYNNSNNNNYIVPSQRQSANTHTSVYLLMASPSRLFVYPLRNDGGA